MDWKLEALIEEQAGMIARRQLNAHAFDADRAQSQIRAGRWVERTPRVISTTTGTLDRDQWLWLAVLHAGPRSMLANLSAAERHGLTGWERPDVSVMVDDQLQLRAGRRDRLLPESPSLPDDAVAEARDSSLSIGAGGPALGGL